MANYVIKIVTDKEKLKDRADEILGKDTEKEVTTIKNQVKDTLQANQDICVLAAPQLGYNKRLFCMKFAKGDIRTFLNPIIVNHKGLHLSREKCASLGNREFLVPRYEEITVAYQTPIGKPETNIFKGPAADLFQQMCQLLDGILIDDIGLEIFEDFDKATDEERTELINWYIGQLKETETQLTKDIQDNPDLKKIDDATRFLTELNLGNVKLGTLTEEETKKMNENIKLLKEKEEK